MKKDNKNFKVTARINEIQQEYLNKLIEESKAKTPSAAIQYLINMAIIRGSNAKKKL